MRPTNFYDPPRTTPCKQCGRPHGTSACAYHDHPDRNTTDSSFAKSEVGRKYEKLEKRSLDFSQRFDASQGVLVPLEEPVRKRIKARLEEIWNKKGKHTINVHTCLIPDTCGTPKCCHGEEGDVMLRAPIKARVGNSPDSMCIHVRALIDTASLQANILSGRIAKQLQEIGGAVLHKASRRIVSGVGQSEYEVNSLIEFFIKFEKIINSNHTFQTILIRALVCPDL
jgi:hypothetical protein